MSLARSMVSAPNTRIAVAACSPGVFVTTRKPPLHRPLLIRDMPFWRPLSPEALDASRFVVPASIWRDTAFYKYSMFAAVNSVSSGCLAPLSSTTHIERPATSSTHIERPATTAGALTTQCFGEFWRIVSIAFLAAFDDVSFKPVLLLGTISFFWASKCCWYFDSRKTTMSLWDNGLEEPPTSQAAMRNRTNLRSYFAMCKNFLSPC